MKKEDKRKAREMAAIAEKALAANEDYIYESKHRPEDFQHYAHEVAKVLYHAEDKGRPTQAFTIDYLGLAREIGILTMLDWLGQKPRIRFGKTTKRRGTVYMELTVASAKAVFDFFQNQRSDYINRWSKIQHGEINDADLRGEAALFVAVNTMLIYVGVKHALDEAKDVGFVGGMLQEMAVFEPFVPRDSWSSLGRRFMEDALSVVEDWPDEGGFVRPSTNVCNAHKAPSTEQKPKKNGKKRTAMDPKRLAFYLTVPGYQGIRYLTGDNPKEYVAIVFTNGSIDSNIVVLDTNTVGNALFVLRGNVSDCLEVAQCTKSEIAHSPFCAKRIVHVPSGNWHEEVENAIRETAVH
jgi:hypothetical protein